MDQQKTCLSWGIYIKVTVCVPLASCPQCMCGKIQFLKLFFFVALTSTSAELWKLWKRWKRRMLLFSRDWRLFGRLLLLQTQRKTFKFENKDGITFPKNTDREKSDRKWRKFSASKPLGWNSPVKSDLPAMDPTNLGFQRGDSRVDHLHKLMVLIFLAHNFEFRRV